MRPMGVTSPPRMSSSNAKTWANPRHLSTKERDGTRPCGGLDRSGEPVNGEVAEVVGVDVLDGHRFDVGGGRVLLLDKAADGPGRHDGEGGVGERAVNAAQAPPTEAVAGQSAQGGERRPLRLPRPPGRR